MAYQRRPIDAAVRLQYRSGRAAAIHQRGRHTSTVTTLTMPLPVPGRHPGRHARPGPVRRAIPAARISASIAAAGLLAAGVLGVAHPAPQRSAPQCVAFRSCPCRYPGAPVHLNGNQLCVAQHESDAPVVAWQARK